MSNWIRFKSNNIESFGELIEDKIIRYEGDMFDHPIKTDQIFDKNNVQLLNPCKPSKMIALWNNYQSLASEKGLSKPNNPL